MPITRRYKVATMKYLERKARVLTFAGVHENLCELDPQLGEGFATWR